MPAIVCNCLQRAQRSLHAALSIRVCYTPDLLFLQCRCWHVLHVFHAWRNRGQAPSASHAAFGCYIFKPLALHISVPSHKMRGHQAFRLV